MSNTKTVMSQAANTQGIPLDITDVFSTYLYDGNGPTQTITNGIDLDGEGGLVWLKGRSGTYAGNNVYGRHILVDTVRGNTSVLSSNDTAAAITEHGAAYMASFNSNGFSIGGATAINEVSSLHKYASWTFRKAPKFFDVVTYTGDGASSQTIPHNLNAEVGCIIVKALNQGTWNWRVYHRTQGSGVGAYLDSDSPFGSTSVFPSTHSTTDFTVAANAEGLNASGEEYVAYLFAHNDGDGEFGPSGDQDIIKCGSYTGDGIQGRTLDIGFEPQWYLIKRTDSSDDWYLFDVLRGATTTLSERLRPNTYDEKNNGFYYLYPNATGLTFDASAGGALNTSGASYIYMAIRRGPLAPPKSATEVFAQQDPGYPVDSNGLAFTSGFPVDLALLKERTNSTDGWYTMSRLQGKGNYMLTNSTASETSGVSYGTFDHNTGWFSTSNASMSWMWKRAPNFFDVVAYTGNGTAGRTVSHNLGVAPEMIWVKDRTSSSGFNWQVYHSGIGATKFLRLNTTNAETTSSSRWNDTAPTSSVFSLGDSNRLNATGEDFIAYLFASLPGISKVGSYSGNGSSQNIDCGFTSGARFVLIKKTNSAANWILFDSARGIVSGNDPYLFLNTTSAEGTGYDLLDPYASGFTIASGDATINASGDSYIFYAIA